jgi:hypothetical protein
VPLFNADEEQAIGHRKACRFRVCAAPTFVCR